MYIVHITSTHPYKMKCPHHYHPILKYTHYSIYQQKRNNSQKSFFDCVPQSMAYGKKFHFVYFHDKGHAHSFIFQIRTHTHTHTHKHNNRTKHSIFFSFSVLKVKQRRVFLSHQLFIPRRTSKCLLYIIIQRRKQTRTHDHQRPVKQDKKKKHKILFGAEEEPKMRRKSITTKTNKNE